MGTVTRLVTTLLCFAAIALCGCATGNGNVPELHIVQTFNKATVWSLEWSPDGRYLAGWVYKEGWVIWDVSSGDPVQRLADATQLIHSLAFTPDGRHLIVNHAMAGTTVERLCLWDVETGQVQPLPIEQGRVRSYAVSTSANALVMLDADNHAKVYDIRTWTKVADWVTESLNGTLALSAAGDRLAVVGPKTLCVSCTDRIAIYDVPSGRRLSSIEQPHASPVFAMAIIGSGQIASAGWQGVTSHAGIVERDDDPVRIWDVRSGGKVTSFAVPGAMWANGLAASIDGRYLALAATNATRLLSQSMFRVWDVGARREISALHDFAGGFHAPAFSPTGQYLAVSLGRTLANFGRDVVIVEIPRIAGVQQSPLAAPDAAASPVN